MVLVVWEIILAVCWLVWYPIGTWLDVQLYKNRILRTLVAQGVAVGPLRNREIWKAYLWRNFVEATIFSMGFLVGLLLRFPV